MDPPPLQWRVNTNQKVVTKNFPPSLSSLHTEEQVANKRGFRVSSSYQILGSSEKVSFQILLRILWRRSYYFYREISWPQWKGSCPDVLWVVTEPPPGTGWLTWTSTFSIPLLSSGFSNVWRVGDHENENEPDQGPQTERDSCASLEVAIVSTRGFGYLLWCPPSKQHPESYKIFILPGDLQVGGKSVRPAPAPFCLYRQTR